MRRPVPGHPSVYPCCPLRNAGVPAVLSWSWGRTAGRRLLQGSIPLSLPSNVRSQRGDFRARSSPLCPSPLMGPGVVSFPLPPASRRPRLWHARGLLGAQRHLRVPFSRRTRQAGASPRRRPAAAPRPGRRRPRLGRRQGAGVGAALVAPGGAEPREAANREGAGRRRGFSGQAGPPAGDGRRARHRDRGHAAG